MESAILNAVQSKAGAFVVQWLKYWKVFLANRAGRPKLKRLGRKNRPFFC
jgi:hypothetical protein